MQITGTVIDGQSKKPLTGATVYLDHTTKATVSSDNGTFVLKNIPSGNYTIISYVGYNSVSVSVNEQYTPRFTVELNPSEKLLNEVVIKANPHYPGRTSYSGNTRFEEMTPANTKEQKKWKSNREKAYYGSLTHFMQSLVNKQLKEDGFVVKKLVKAEKPGANRPVL